MFFFFVIFINRAVTVLILIVQCVWLGYVNIDYLIDKLVFICTWVCGWVTWFLSTSFIYSLFPFDRVTWGYFLGKFNRQETSILHPKENLLSHLYSIEEFTLAMKDVWNVHKFCSVHFYPS